ncbi:thioredoxin fold domain-containing protein [Ramlibacter sp.]|uniref:thioredoxin fold domain-containing protein n=1 Tax=Ramlibacter sp. TaxID=1917967 RepID=UPI0025F31E31|nr:thioredoxin fold domain-containing protein [Ramlibacter sp.]
MNMRLIPVLLAAVLATAACKDAGNSSSPSGAASASAPAAQAPVSLDAIAAEAKGFSVGPAMSARVVYVFFDAQCPHCGALWEAAKPLKNQARFVWIPVRLLNDSSLSQGAALLAASDPVAAMDAHEASLLAKSGGIAAGGVADAQKAAVKHNTELFTRYSFGSVPTLVTKQAQTGAVVTQEGSMQTGQLAVFLGVPVPGGS